MAAARCRKRRLDHTMALQQETDIWEEKKQGLQNEIRQLQKQKDELERLLESHRPQCKFASRKGGLVPPPPPPPHSFNNKPLLGPQASAPQPTPSVSVPPKNRLNIKQERHELSDDSYSSEEGQMDSFHLSRPRVLSQQPQQQQKHVVEFMKPAPRPRPTSLPVASSFNHHPPPPAPAAGRSEIAGISITTPSSGIPGFNFESLMDGGTGLTPIVASPSCSTQQRSSNVLPVDLSSPDSVNRKLVSL